MSKVLTLLVSVLISFSLYAETKNQKKMIALIDSMASVYESMYAPVIWKRQFANWTLQAEVSRAKEKILSKELTLKEFHQVVNQFVLSMKDFHVSVSFHSTESAKLPFTVKSAEGRYFIVYIDRNKLDYASFPFSVGDELISMDGVAIDDIVSSIKANLGGNTSETDQSLAELILTSRRASRAHGVIPQGPVTLTIKKGGKKVSHQLIWEYKKELVSRRLPKKKSRDSKSLLEIADLEMSSDLALEFADEANADNKFALGTRSSYLPALGTKIWENDKDKHHDAYIYMNDKKELIGYVRIPKYGAGAKEAAQFLQIIKKFESITDKLVIDQLNNPGGSVFYLYSLVSMLTTKPMQAPKHYMAINQKMVSEAIRTLDTMSQIRTNAQLRSAFGTDTVSGYPLSMTFLEFMKSYYGFIIDEWNAGKSLTSPYHLYGVDKINPHPQAQYSKPILLLVNELDFSGGDFFPAIMQDNKRATIMGVRTAGAGGYVIGVDIPNQFGVGGFRYTGSLADRVNRMPIENLGVTPDIDYSLTVKDIKSRFTPFKNKINEVLNTLK